MRFKTSLFILFLFSIPLVFSQNYHELTFKNFTKKDNLSDNTIRKMVLDERGFLWLGTENKINKFDGENFKQYGYSDSNNPGLICYDLLYTQENELFVLTENLVLIYNKAYDKLEKFHLPQLNIHQCHSGIRQAKDGSLYFWGAKSYIERESKTGQWKEHLYSEFKGEFPKFVYRLFKKSENILWIGAHDGIYELNLSTKISTKILHTTARVYEFLMDHQKRIWITSQLGLFIYTNGQFHPVEKVFKKYPKELVQIDTRSVHQANDSTVYISTDTEGILVFKEEFQQQLLKTNKNNLPNNQVWSLTTDHHNNIFIGNYRGGLSIANAESKYILNIPNSSIAPHGFPAEHPISTFNTLNDSTLIVITDGSGAFTFNLNNNELWPIEGGKHHPKKMITLVKEESKIWMSTWNEGLYSYDIQQKEYHKLQPEEINAKEIPTNFLDIIKDHKGWIWGACLDNGLFLFHEKKKKHIHLSPQKLGMENLKGSYGFTKIFKIGQDEIWATLLNSIVIFKWDGDSVVMKKRIYSTQKDGAFELISCIKKTPNGILIASKKGILKIDPHTYQVEPFVSYSLIDSEIKNIEYLPQHNLYVFTSSLKIFIYHPEDKKVIVIDKNDGIAPGEFINNSMTQLDDGIVIGSTKGMYLISNRYFIHKPKTPHIYVQDFLIDFKNYLNLPQFSDYKSIENLSSLPILTSNNTYTLSIGDIAPVVKKKVMYEYKILGYQDKWIKIHGSNQITFNKLPYGQYELHIRGKYEKENYSKTIKYRLVFPPEYYQTWWFITLMVLFSISVLYTLFNLRTRTIKKRNKELEDRVKERTHFIEEQKDEILSQAESLQEQHDVISIQKLEMEESIEVSKRIQEEAMSNQDPIRHNFSNYAMHFQQRDAVGGDFFWTYESNTHVFLAIGDCTGHGVAGGMLTLIALNILNNVVTKSNDVSPGELMNHLNQGFRKTLHQEQKGTFGKDGLDISLIKMHKKTKLMQYSGAVNPIYVKHDNEIIKLKVNPISIGIRPRGRENIYETHEYQLVKGSFILGFSDGISDQFSTSYDDIQKFSTAQVVQTFNETNDCQRFIQQLKAKLEDWKKEEPQTDDMIALIVEI